MGCSNNKIVGSVSESPIKEIKLVNKVQPAETFISEHVKEPVTISFVGDIMMDRSVKQAMNQYGVDYPYQEIHDEITKADFAIANVETSITNGGVEFPKQYNFRSCPDSVLGLKNAGFDLVSLANNHTMDYGIVGLQDTFTNLKAHNLKYMGAGNNSDEAYRAVEVMIKGKKLKFLAFSRVLPDISWYPENQKPGIASAYQEELVIKTIEKENHDTDYLFVYIHWGTEKAIYPSKEQRKYAYNMIDAGADGVIGSHPHVLQGFEYYKEKPIAYSLGNFLFPDYVSGKSAETGIITLFIRKDDIQMNFSPYYIENNQIVSKDKLYVKKQLDYLSSISYMDHYNGKLIVNK